MNIFISENDRQNARSVALKNIARFFNINNWEYKSNDELKIDLESLRNDNAIEIVKLLNEYFFAYDEWFKFYQTRKSEEVNENNDNELTHAEKEQLRQLIERRESTLTNLQNEFDRLQLIAFNRSRFGADLTGNLNEGR